MTNYYDPDIRAQQDYEAMNADVRRQLSAALKRIKELEALCEFHIAETKKADAVVLKENRKLRKRIEQLEGVLGDMAKQPLYEEMDDMMLSGADWITACDIFVTNARAALQAEETDDE